MKSAIDDPEATDTDEVDGLCGFSIEGTAALAGWAGAAREKSVKEEAASDRRERIEFETTRCEKVLKDTSTGKQGRHKKSIQSIRDKAKQELKDLQNDILPSERKQPPTPPPPPKPTADELRNAGAGSHARRRGVSTAARVRPVGPGDGKAKRTHRTWIEVGAQADCLRCGHGNGGGGAGVRESGGRYD
ncbi:unnamed protein product, partial [Laminaria digitata]